MNNQEECKHEELIEVTLMFRPEREYMCRDCGKIFKESELEKELEDGE